MHYLDKLYSKFLHDVIEVSELTYLPAIKAWSTLTDIKSWREWWVGDILKKVEPGWASGSSMVWEEKEPSVIQQAIPPVYLEWSWCFRGQIINYFLKFTCRKTGSTMVTYGMKIKHGKFPAGFEHGQKKVMHAALINFLKRAQINDMISFVEKKSEG